MQNGSLVKVGSIAESTGGYLGVSLVHVFAPVIFKPTQIIYFVFEKNDLIIYLILQNAFIFIYSSLIFILDLLSVNTVYK